PPCIIIHLSARSPSSVSAAAPSIFKREKIFNFPSVTAVMSQNIRCYDTSIVVLRGSLSLPSPSSPRGASFSLSLSLSRLCSSFLPHSGNRLRLASPAPPLICSASLSLSHLCYDHLLLSCLCSGNRLRLAFARATLALLPSPYRATLPLSSLSLSIRLSSICYLLPSSTRRRRTVKNRQGQESAAGPVVVVDVNQDITRDLGGPTRSFEAKEDARFLEGEGDFRGVDLLGERKEGVSENTIADYDSGARSADKVPAAEDKGSTTQLPEKCA
ncbi:hypothetical protein ACLOJK_004053, partial [Asimina triloba]